MKNTRKKESLIRIARGKLEEWEASGKMDGLISKKTNEELSQALNIELIQTKEEINNYIEEEKKLWIGPRFLFPKGSDQWRKKKLLQTKCSLFVPS